MNNFLFNIRYSCYNGSAIIIAIMEVKKRKSNPVKLSLTIFSVLLVITFVASLGYSYATNVSATDSADASVNVSAACTMTGSGNNSHTATITPGTAFTGNIGTTNIVASCNDPNGYSVYAIGYSGNPSTLGNTDLINTNATIATRAYDASYTTSSYWSMKLTAGQGTDAATIVTTPTDYSTYVAVPSDYAKVATKTSATSASPTTAFSTTYGVYATAIQAAGEYVGKVKYVLVHPNTAPAPVAPLADSDCPAGRICYAPNADDIEGSMDSISGTKIAKSPTAGVDSTITNSRNVLVAPNYSRSGYGFAGWSPDYNATSSSIIYGPSQSITTKNNSSGDPNADADISQHGLILYPVWVASTGNLQNWNGCSNLTPVSYDSETGTLSATLSSVTALTDQRDGNVYTVARLADGKCWMVENLRLDADNTRGNTNKTLSQGYKTYSGIGTNFGDFIGLADSENSNFNTSNANSLYYSGTQSGTASENIGIYDSPKNRIPRYNNDNTKRSNTASRNGVGQWYSYGNYYNWPAAMANTASYYYKNTTDADGYTSETVGTSLCPAGWRLPYGDATGNGAAPGGFSYLDICMGGAGTGESVNSVTGDSMSFYWRHFPNNMVISGMFFTNSPAMNKNIYGYYWTSTASDISNSEYAMRVFMNSGRIYPGTDHFDKTSGEAIRCVMSS